MSPPTDPEDERVEVGVAIVGGGPGGLACAIRLTQLLEEEPALRDELGEVPVALVERGRGRAAPAVGRDHAAGRPRGAAARGAARGVADLRRGAQRRGLPADPAPRPQAPAHPAALPQRGQPRGLVARLGHWLAERAEEAGVFVLGETAAAKLLVDDGEVRGVRTGDKGRGREGEAGALSPARTWWPAPPCWPRALRDT